MVKRSVILLLPLTLLLSGCIHIEEIITLQPDLSGRVHYKIVFPQIGLRFLPGKPNRQWVHPNLPEGMQLDSFTNAQTTTTITGDDGKEHELENEVFDCDLSFTDIRQLNEVRVLPDSRNEMSAAAGGTPGMTASVDEPAAQREPGIGPFQQFTVNEENGLLRFRRVVQAARDRDEDESKMMGTPGSTAHPQSIDLSDSVFSISIKCPGEVREHNAHQVDGNTLTWQFNLEELQEHQDRDWTVEFTLGREDQK